MTHTPSLSIAQRRASILEKIESVNSDQMVTLVAASKRQPEERISAMLAAGQRVFGENRVQEAEEHWSQRKEISDLELRLIGPLQTNKAEQAVRLFDVIETLDRPKLAKALRAAADKTGVQPPPVLIMGNTGEEAKKSGVMPPDLQDLMLIEQHECCLPVCVHSTC